MKSRNWNAILILNGRVVDYVNTFSRRGAWLSTLGVVTIPDTISLVEFCDMVVFCADGRPSFVGYSVKYKNFPVVAVVMKTPADVYSFLLDPASARAFNNADDMTAYGSPLAMPNLQAVELQWVVALHGMRTFSRPS